jgi:hypothetical protein
MKYAFALVLLTLGATAQAQLLLPKGTKAALEVQYLYTAEGNSGRGKNVDAIDEWKVRRALNLTARYVAEEPTAIGVLHQSEAQNAALDAKAKQAQDFGKKMQPTYDDMMKIAERCGDDEGCIEKAISDYANKMDLKEMQARKSEANAIFKMDAPRYQLWKVTGQTGTYDIDELVTRQVFEMTCTQVKVCKRTVTRTGKGAIPAPPGRDVESASLLEIDSVGKDIAAKMPMPMRELPVKTNVQSNIPDDDYQATGSLPMHQFKNADTLTLAITSGQLPASGSKTIKNTGKGAESGTLTVTWTFKRT